MQRQRTDLAGSDGLSLPRTASCSRARCRRCPDGLSVIAGYPWFGDWGRDTMISLPG